MRSLFLASALAAVVNLAVFAPGSASAQRWRNQAPNYYQGYSYDVPTVAYYVAPSGPSYGASYGYSGAPIYQMVPVAPDFRPIYSGPQYFQGYAPPRLLIYPDNGGRR